tara:strand:- start:97 stop:585 length:489 start_codon:yes stop_codon:yes gene_type:complete
MAKVGRAARVASRQRVESVTADKTIQSGETGELYLVDQTAGGVTITLPSRQDGAYFKFLIPAQLTGLDSKKITIQSAASGVTNGELVGSSLTVGNSLATTHGTHQHATTGDAHPQFIIEADASGRKLYAGSHVEITCDGTRWYVSALLIADNVAVIGKFHGT